jgi:NodT family efflux transporter outer membrane factor (OMF) lipoprotein
MNTMSHSRSSSSAKLNLTLWAAIISSALVVLPSCGIPKLDRAKPGSPLPETFNGTTTAESSAQLEWCAFFDDPHLANLIQQALVGNQELRILNEEIRIANYEIMARQGEYLPFVSFGSRAALEKSSRFTREGAVEEELEVAPGKAFPEPLPDFLVAANVSWEIDIWKKLRNARSAAALRYLGTREGRNYVVTRMVAEVAENYYELLALDNRLATLDKTIQIQEQTLETAKALKAAARATELAVQRFEAEVRKNQSERLIIQQEIVEVENRINFLVGRFPQQVARASVNYIDLNLHALSLGVPSQLLQNRADIRQAERELAAAGLDVRVARARFYPSLTLTSDVGLRAFNPKYLFMTPESFFYNVAGELVAPLINKKAIQADYLTANSMQLQRVYDYQRVVLNAFTEVINRMAKVDNYGKSIELKKQQLASLEASVDSATLLFQNARAEYMEVLLAQRDLLEARMALIETKQQQLAALVSAYQALGGGGPTDQCELAGGAFDPLAPLEDIHFQQPLQLPPESELLPPSATPAAPQSLQPPPGPELLPPPASGDSNGDDGKGPSALPIHWLTSIHEKRTHSCSAKFDGIVPGRLHLPLAA